MTLFSTQLKARKKLFTGVFGDTLVAPLFCFVLFCLKIRKKRDPVFDLILNNTVGKFSLQSIARLKF